MRDLHNNIKVTQLLSAQAITSTTNSSGLDTKGFDSAELLVNVGTITNIGGSPNPDIELRLQDSDDDSTYAAVTDANDVLVDANSRVAAPNSDGMFSLIDAAAEDALHFRIGYRGTKRYVRVAITASSEAIGSTPVSVNAIQGHPAIRPSTD